MALAVCVSVVVLLCGAPSPCYALVNTSECAHTPRVLSLLSAQPRKHTHLGQVAGGEKKNHWTQTYWQDCLGIGKGVNKLFVCVFVSAHPLMVKSKTDKQHFQKVPRQSGKFCSPITLGMTQGSSFSFSFACCSFCYFVTTEVSQKRQQVVKTRPWIPNPFYAVQNSPPLTISWVAGFQGKLLHFSKNMRFRRETRYRPARVRRRRENMGSSTNEAKSTCSSRFAAGW